MEYDIKKRSSIFENININKDIYKFINHHKTNITTLTKYEYIPYISMAEKSKNKTYEELNKNVRLFMNNIFTKERPTDMNPNSDFNKNKNISNEIRELINIIFKKEKISKKDMDNIHKILLIKKSRRKILKEINNYCLNNSNSSLLDENCFDNLSFLLKESLSIQQIEKDYESVNLILTLSTRCYKIKGEKEKKKIFVQNSLINHNVLMKYEFWKEFTKFLITEEMFNEKKYNLLDNKLGNEEEKQKRIKNIIKNKINSILNYMIEFQIKDKFMKQLIQDMKEYYELDENEIVNFNKKIDDYKKESISSQKNENNSDEIQILKIDQSIEDIEKKDNL